MVECIYNRELEAPINTPHFFFVLSKQVREKFGINYDQGEMLIYTPGFMPEYGCCWVAQTSDFDIIEMDELING